MSKTQSTGLDYKVISKEIDLNGRKLKLETGKLANQADASVVVSWGETVVLATAVAQPLKADIGYFPLSVEYVEKHYAGGRISSSKFIKRETRPSDEAVLTGRLIDRSIRPLFPKDFRTHEVQVIITVLSIDQANDPDIIGLIGASAALSISSIPWKGPLAGARVGAKDGQLEINPTISELEHLDMDLFVAASKDKVAMIETQANQVDDAVVFAGIKAAHEASQPVIELINDFVKQVGKPKMSYVSRIDSVDPKVLKEVKAEIHKVLEEVLMTSDHPWRDERIDNLKAALIEKYPEHAETLTADVLSELIEKVAKELMNDVVLNQHKRIDGREMEQVRPLYMEVGLLPRTHGSALFARGQSQILSVVTLGAPSLQQTLEGMEGERQKRFMHHYNMGSNPFASGEVKRLGSPNRRDIGHGALVEKALIPVIPSLEEFPYAIRVVSEVLESNASTSQASISASTLALMNAGVSIKAPVAGIALGLLSNEKAFQVITDMQAVEDFFGEMDFKVAGTDKGITAIQMDTKLEGLTFAIIEEALKQGKNARKFILEQMSQVLSEVGPLSPHAPRVETLHIEPSEIGALIGPGGKNINGIIAKTGASIDIEDDGTVMVSGTNSEGVDKAIEAIENMFKKVEVGEEYTGKVVRIAPFGAFVEILPGKDGLVHVSQMAPGRVEKPEDVVSEGQEVHVRVTDVTPEGKVGLSMLFGADIKPESESRPSGGGRDRAGSRPFGGGERRGFGSRESGARPGGFGGSRPFGGGSRGGFDRNRPDRNRGGGRSGDRGGRGGFSR